MSHAETGRVRPKALLIAGPTASGKSALALRLARRLGGRIINADSMQVYRDLWVLTARPSEAEMATAPHALYGTIDGAETFSVSRWLAAAAAELSRAQRDAALPIFVGGTGLYFKALTQGLSAIPDVPDEVRRDIRRWAVGRSSETLHGELVRRDPQTAAGLRPSDPQRILRALEVHAATGEGLASYQERREAPLLLSGTWRAVALTIERPILRERIGRRFDVMIMGGALDEVAALAARGLDSDLPVMRAIGVRSLLRHHRGEIDMPAAIGEATTASRQYVKRQETFLRHQLPDFRPVLPEEAEAALADQSS